MNQTCRAANFRALLRDAEIQHEIEEILEAYDKVNTEDNRGTRIADGMKLLREEQMSGAARPSIDVKVSSRRYTIPETVYRSLLGLLNQELGWEHYVDYRLVRRRDTQEFLTESAVICTEVKLGGVKYKPSHRDSNILVKERRGSQAAKLEAAFLHRRFAPTEGEVDEVFLVISKLQSLSHQDKQHDRYRLYGPPGEFLCYNHYLDFEVIRPEKILCHFAKTEITVQDIPQPCIHVLPLDRVCYKSI
jgi:hypothetical protein